MANALYDSAKALIRSGGVDWEGDKFEVALIDGRKYVPKASHKTLADVPPRAVIGKPASLLNTRIVGNAANADAVLFEDMCDHAGLLVSSLLIYHVGDNANTSNLIACINNAHGTLPLITNGGDINIGWDSGPNKIFAIPTAGKSSNQPKEVAHHG